MLGSAPQGGKPTLRFPDGKFIDTQGIDEPLLMCFCFLGPTGVTAI
jgi:hypothetical protein